MSNLIAAIYAYDRNETTANELLDTLRAAPTVHGFSHEDANVEESLALVYGLKIVNEVELTLDESDALFDFIDENEGRDDLAIESGAPEYNEISAAVFEEGKVLFVPYMDENGEPTAKFFSLESVEA